MIRAFRPIYVRRRDILTATSPSIYSTTLQGRDLEIDG